MELTDAGRLFLGEARATLAQAQRAEQAVRDAGRGIRGRLRVGFVTSACHTVLPVVVRNFRSAYPAVEIILREMTPAEQLAGIERREIAVGFLRPPMVQPGIDIEVIMSEPLVAALPQAHPLARRATVSLKEMRGESFVLFPRRHGPGLYDVIMTACQEAGFRPVLAHEPDEMQSLLAHIAGGLGVSLVPASLMGFFPADIEYRRLRGSRTCVELAVVWSHARKSAITDNFCALALEAGKACLGRMKRSLQRD